MPRHGSIPPSNDQVNVNSGNNHLVLGTCFRAVVAAAHRGGSGGGGGFNADAARQLFDETAMGLYDRAHPLVRLKYRSLDRLPFYNLQRERAAIFAARIASTQRTSFSAPSSVPSTSVSRTQTESRLTSADGLIAGRPDHIDGSSQTVVDYKTGQAEEPVSDSETRQLRLYAQLARDNGVAVSRGAIVRGDGSRSEISISAADAEAEASNARERLSDLNAAVRGGAAFGDLATPSTQSCRVCPCVPFCTAFWNGATAGWQPECGVHVQGAVVDIGCGQIQGVSLTSLLLAVQAGTISHDRALIEQIPTEWLTVEVSEFPSTGDVIRIVNGRLAGEEGTTSVIRVDKTLTALWRIL
jgi:hypothetical protein